MNDEIHLIEPKPMTAEQRAAIERIVGHQTHAVRLALVTLLGAHDYWMRRSPVTAEDVERAGVTWAHVDAWVVAQPDGDGAMATDGRPLWSWRKTRDSPDGPTWQYGVGLLIHRGMSLAAVATCVAANFDLPAHDILDEMAAAS